MPTNSKKGQSVSGQVKNTLNRKQLRHLEDWVSAHKAEIEKFNWTKQQVAIQASQKLGHVVSEANVNSAGKVMGVEFPRSHSNRTNDKIPRQALVEAIRVVRELAGELGKTVPPIITEFLEAELRDRPLNGDHR